MARWALVSEGTVSLVTPCYYRLMPLFEKMNRKGCEFMKVTTLITVRSGIWIEKRHGLEFSGVTLCIFIYLLFFLFLLASMASPFKIPKKKQPAGSDSSHVQMQSPLSRLRSSSPEFKVV